MIKLKKTRMEMALQSKLLPSIIILLVFIFAMGIVNATSWTSSLNNGLQSYYKLDDSTGNVLDNFGFNNGTISAGVVRGITGVISNAYNFTPNSYINISTSLASYNMSNFTVSMWIYPYDLTSEAYPIDHRGIGEGDNARPFSVQLITNNIRFSLARQSDASEINVANSETLSTNRWIHTVVTYDSGSGDAKLYLNGTLQNTGNFVGGGTLKNQGVVSWLIGSKSDLTKGFKGKIDEVGIWNRSLSIIDVQSLYNNGNGLTLPAVNLNYPIDSSILLTNTSNIFNCSYGDVSQSILNITLVINGINNYTIYNSSSGQNYIGMYRATTFRKEGEYNWSCSITTTTKTLSSDVYHFNTSLFKENSLSYNPSTLEGSTESFSINVSIDPTYRISTAYLNYNNSDYISSITIDGNNNYLLRSLTIPEVNYQVNNTFYFKINLDSGLQVNTALTNQSVGTLGIDNCSAYTFQLFNITLLDEEVQNILSGGTENTSIKVTFTLSSSNGAIQLINYSHNFQYENPARLCLQNNLSNASYRLDGLIQYSSRGRFNEFYNFQNYNLTLTNSDVKINLYNLNSSVGTEFKVIYKDSNFVPVSDALLNIQRKYIDEGLFKTTEIPKTGTEGYTIAHLVSNDVIYNIIVIKNGEVLATFNDVVADCQNPLLNSCQINLNSYSSSTLPSDFNNYKDMSLAMSFNRTTRIVSALYSIPSGINSWVQLNVTLFDSLGNKSVCSDILFSSGGQLSCTIPSSFGNSSVIANIYKDGEFIAQAIINLNQKPSDIYGNSLIFLALFLLLIFLGIGASSDSPMTFGIVIILGSIVMVAMNLIYTPSWVGAGATILWFIIAVVLVMVRGANRT